MAVEDESCGSKWLIKCKTSACRGSGPGLLDCLPEGFVEGINAEVEFRVASFYLCCEK